MLGSYVKPEPEPPAVSPDAAAPEPGAAAEADTAARTADQPAAGTAAMKQLAPFLGGWFEDKSHGDVASLSTFLTACDWSWTTRPFLTNAPNQMWVVEQHADDGPCEMRIGVELNALMQKLVQLVGAAPFVRYDCSGAEFEFELFTGVTGKATVSWEGPDLHLHKVICAPAYVLDCHWVYSVVRPAAAAAAVEKHATCKADYEPSHETAMAMSAGEACRVLGDVGAEWTKVSVNRDGADVVGHVPTSFLKLATPVAAGGGAGGADAAASVGSAEEAVPPAAVTHEAAADVPFGSREEMWCLQVNTVFKRAVVAEAIGQAPGGDSSDASASLKGEAVPEMDHSMHQVWVRAQDGDGGMLGMLMR